MRKLSVVIAGHIGMGSTVAACFYHHPIVLIECPGHTSSKPAQQEFYKPNPEVLVVNYAALGPSLSEDFVLEKILQFHVSKTVATSSPVTKSLIPKKAWYHPLWSSEPSEWVAI